MQRITKSLLSVLAGLLLGISQVSQAQDLEAIFTNPPRFAKPYTWWHWMNGHLSKEGITGDLEAMKAAGIGGVHCFNVGVVGPGRVQFASDEWYDLMIHGIKEAERLGIEYVMHNTPGWSSSGGFWITPELAMKQISWSEAHIQGGSKVDMVLPKPDMALERYWDDIVVAYPSLPGESLEVMKATRDGDTVMPSELSVNAPEDVKVEKALTVEFASPVVLQSVLARIAREAQALPGGYPPMMRGGAGVDVEVSLDGKQFRKVAAMSVVRGVPSFASFAPVKARYLRLASASSFSVKGLEASSLPYNTDYLGDAFYAIETGRMPGTATARKDRTVPAAYSVDPGKVVDLTSFMDADGRLRWDAPEGEWTVIRLGYVPIDRKPNAAPESGTGLECDKFSREAMNFHLDYLCDRLVPALESVAKNVSGGMLIDSYEVGNNNWTNGMKEEFRSRRGYPISSYVPALVGKYVGDSETTERFLWDFRRTCADLFVDNYTGTMSDWCKKHGLLFYTEPYSTTVFDELQVASRVDVPMGEFWTRTGGYRLSTKMVSSVVHTNGINVDGAQIVGAESYTGWNSESSFQNYPYSLKAQGDDAFTEGLTRIIFHRFTHQPNNKVAPGMSMSNIGLQFDRTTTWFPKSTEWLRYIARCQGLLQQGGIVADVLMLLDENIPTRGWDTWDPVIPEGYYADETNNETFLSKIKVEGSKLVSADGNRYSLLVLQTKDERLMSLDVLKKIHAYVMGGGTVCGNAPDRTPGISTPEEIKEFDALRAELWGGLRPGQHAARGCGRVYATKDVEAVLRDMGIGKDVSLSYREDAPIGFIHKQVGGTQVYFLANKRRTQETPVVTFRADGLRPELWNPSTGEITPLKVYDVLPGGNVRVPMDFDPYGSWFVVFRENGNVPHYTLLSKGNETLVSTETFPEKEGGVYADVKENFTVSVWIRPESNTAIPVAASGNAEAPWRAGSANSCVYYPGNGALLYGEGHSIVAIDASRLGVSVVERAGEGAPVCVLSYNKKIASWTHVGLVYEDGAPVLYVNGAEVAKGNRSDYIVHPSYKDVGVVDDNLFLEGDFDGFEIIGRPLSAGEISALCKKGAPEKALPDTKVRYADNGFLFFEGGKYSLKASDGSSRQIKLPSLPAPINLSSAGWKVAFEEGRGAPESIEMPTLIPLDKHGDERVRFFSGTATYTTSFTLKDFKGKKLFLNLGRVFVLASVKLNGKDLGIVWKDPYEVDITSAAVAGKNVLEIEVTNLWTNRLIGDAQTPDVYDFGSGMAMSGAFPQWFEDGLPKPDDGKTVFSIVKFFEGDEPLYDSGLVGPVTIRQAVYVALP